MRATPWPRAANRGRFSFDSTKMHSAVGWAKALARPPTQRKSLVRRAHQRTSMQAAASMVGTAYDRLSLVERRCHRLCPPYKLQTVAALQQNETTNACDFNDRCHGIGLAMIFSARHDHCLQEVRERHV